MGCIPRVALSGQWKGGEAGRRRNAQGLHGALGCLCTCSVVAQCGGLRVLSSSQAAEERERDQGVGMAMCRAPCISSRQDTPSPGLPPFPDTHEEAGVVLLWASSVTELCWGIESASSFRGLEAGGSVDPPSCLSEGKVAWVQTCRSNWACGRSLPCGFGIQHIHQIPVFPSTHPRGDQFCV